MVAEATVAQSHTLLTHPLGLHARPAVRLAQLAARFQAEVFMRVNDQGEWVSTRSAAQLMRLRARTNSVVSFRAEGEDAREAVVEMVALVDRDFNDTPQGEWSVPAGIASPGLASGSLWIIRPPPPSPPPAAASPEDEAGRLARALEMTGGELRALAAGVEPGAARILAVQLALLADEEFLAPLWSALNTGSAAQAAWRALLETAIREHLASPDEYQRIRCLDLQDLGQRVEQHLRGQPPPAVQASGEILLCPLLAPSRFLELDPEKLRGLVLTEGDVISHVASLARCRGVPMLINPRLEPHQLAAGTEVVVDAEAGRLVANPKVTTMTRYSKTLAVRAMEAAVSDQFLMEPGQFGDGEPVRVCLDVADLTHLDGLDPGFCDGIGRVRSEALFRLDQGWPDEQTQYRRYLRLLEWAEGLPVAVSTLNPEALTGLAELEARAADDSPLGLRGIRLCQAAPALFRDQLRALCRAASEGDLRVLLPMVSTPTELEQMRRLFEETVGALNHEGLAARLPVLGLLLAVPAAALALEHFQVEVVVVELDGLLQYLLAADRRCERLDELRDLSHPAVQALLRRIVEQAGARGVDLSVCADFAGRPEWLATLLALGVRAVDVPPRQLARAKAGLAEL